MRPTDTSAGDSSSQLLLCWTQALRPDHDANLVLRYTSRLAFHQVEDVICAQLYSRLRTHTHEKQTEEQD